MVSLDDVRGTRIPGNEWRGEAWVCEWLRMIGARRGGGGEGQWEIPRGVYRGQQGEEGGGGD